MYMYQGHFSYFISQFLISILLFVVKIKEYCRVNSLHIIDLLATATPKLAKTDGGETRKDGGWECYDGGVGRYLVRYLVSHLVISGSGR